MSRISYSDDEDYPGQHSLFRANLHRSLSGKRGQAALRDLEAALLALPEKRLISHHLIKDGEVCATGALVALRRQQKLHRSREEVLSQMEAETGPNCDTCWHSRRRHLDDGVCLGCPDSIRRWREYLAQTPSVVRQYGPDRHDMVCQTYVAAREYDDEDEEGETEAAAEGEGVPPMVAWAIVEENDDMSGSVRDETDEQRYERVLKWVRWRQAINLQQAMSRDMP